MGLYEKRNFYVDRDSFKSRTSGFDKLCVLPKVSCPFLQFGTSVDYLIWCWLAFSITSRYIKYESWTSISASSWHQPRVWIFEIIGPKAKPACMRKPSGKENGKQKKEIRKSAMCKSNPLEVCVRWREGLERSFCRTHVDFSSNDWSSYREVIVKSSSEVLVGVQGAPRQHQASPSSVGERSVWNLFPSFLSCRSCCCFALLQRSLVVSRLGCMKRSLWWCRVIVANRNIVIAVSYPSG